MTTTDILLVVAVIIGFNTAMICIAIGRLTDAVDRITQEATDAE